MQKSTDEKVQHFLEGLMMANNEQFTILQNLRDLIFRYYPNVSERFMYGGIIFSLDDHFAGLFVRKNHVSLEFGQGHRMNDSYALLEGSGKFRRHLKFRSLADIEDKKASFYIQQAAP